MPRVTPEEGADKLIKNAQAAAPRIAAQVDKVKVAPTQAAKDKKEKLVARLMAALQDGKWERGLDRVSLEDWKKSMKEKGIPRIGQGLELSRPKIEAFNKEFYAHLTEVEAEIAAMPDTTLEENIQRMVHNVRRNASFKRSR